MNKEPGAGRRGPGPSLRTPVTSLRSPVSSRQSPGGGERREARGENQRENLRLSSCTSPLVAGGWRLVAGGEGGWRALRHSPLATRYPLLATICNHPLPSRV